VRVVSQHRSRYHYPKLAPLGSQRIRLRPADHARADRESAAGRAPEHRLPGCAIRTAIASRAFTFKAGQAVSELDVPVELAVESNAIAIRLSRRPGSAS
jgi:hypothetical protein